MNKIIAFAIIAFCVSLSCASWSANGFGVSWDAQIIASTMDSVGVPTAVCTLTSKWCDVAIWNSFALFYTIADTATGTDSVFYRLWIEYSQDTTSTAYLGTAAIDSITAEGSYRIQLANILPALYMRFRLISGAGSGANNGKFVRLSKFNLSKQH